MERITFTILLGAVLLGGSIIIIYYQVQTIKELQSKLSQCNENNEKIIKELEQIKKEKEAIEKELEQIKKEKEAIEKELYECKTERYLLAQEKESYTTLYNKCEKNLQQVLDASKQIIQNLEQKNAQLTEEYKTIYNYAQQCRERYRVLDESYNQLKSECIGIYFWKTSTSNTISLSSNSLLSTILPHNSSFIALESLTVVSSILLGTYLGKLTYKKYAIKKYMRYKRPD